MLKKLRIKFICINMVIVAVMLCIIFGLMIHFTGIALENESIRMMQLIGSGPPQLQRPGAAPEAVRLPYFTLQMGPKGELLAAGHSDFDLSDQEYLRQLAQAAYASEGQIGVLTDYDLRFYKAGAPDRQYLVFVDMSSEKATMGNLIESCLFIGSAALAGFFVVSLFLARWAVRPVDEAWQRQKQFIADASHELKTPLTVILTNAELLQDPLCQPQLQNQASESILAMSRQMRGLVESLLELARVDNGTVRTVMTPTDLSALVSDGLLPFEPLYFEQQRQLSTQIASGLWVKGSAEHLKQVLDILLDNALKYSAPGAEVRVGLNKLGNHALLMVANPGPAMSPQELKDIFKRFYRADKARSMTGSYGLGLSIAQRIVADHRGKIWAESRDGINSFFVQLPLRNGT